ncbi:hypothetical protein L2E82_19304 [Cichorium intybus]|uniref:Uncharacterized protein n=1 Tax=Cichorium intybus TaxID=13427 RepID=A0ACB9FCW5_CICIN|nr:hypothetical protein L2E82_19304 [Cichorium intybus]
MIARSCLSVYFARPYLSLHNSIQSVSDQAEAVVVVPARLKTAVKDAATQSHYRKDRADKTKKTMRSLELGWNIADDIQSESKALARAINATVYNPEILKFKYVSSPFKILVGLGLFGLKLWLGKLQGQLDQNRRARAIELRETFTKLGHTFIKTGQGLSTDPISAHRNSLKSSLNSR